MSLPYERALAMIEERCANYLESIMASSTPRDWLPMLRERRDHWHGIGSRIKHRQERESRRDK